LLLLFSDIFCVVSLEIKIILKGVGLMLAVIVNGIFVLIIGCYIWEIYSLKLEIKKGRNYNWWYIWWFHFKLFLCVRLLIQISSWNPPFHASQITQPPIWITPTHNSNK